MREHRVQHFCCNFACPSVTRDVLSPVHYLSLNEEGSHDLKYTCNFSVEGHMSI